MRWGVVTHFAYHNFSIALDFRTQAKSACATKDERWPDRAGENEPRGCV